MKLFKTTDGGHGLYYKPDMPKIHLYVEDVLYRAKKRILHLVTKVKQLKPDLNKKLLKRQRGKSN